MIPKYSVGELVIVQSKSRPNLNSEYTVLKVLKMKTTIFVGILAD